MTALALLIAVWLVAMPFVAVFVGRAIALGGRHLEDGDL